MSFGAGVGRSQTFVRGKMWMHVWCFGCSNFMPGRGGVGAVIALAFAAFWDAEVEVVEAAESAFLLTAVEVETTVLETTTAAEVFVVEAGFLDEVTEFAGAAEAGFDGGFAEDGGFAAEGGLTEDGALEEPCDPAFDSAFEETFDAALTSEAGLVALWATVLVTVFVEVPLTVVFVSVTTISLPLTVVSSPVTCISFKGAAGLTVTAIQGVTKIGIARRIGVGGGGGVVAGM
jgi:hypothetical protein